MMKTNKLWSVLICSFMLISITACFVNPNMPAPDEEEPAAGVETNENEIETINLSEETTDAAPISEEPEGEELINEDKRVAGVVDQMINGMDGAEMVYVPAGDFTMGSSAEDIEWVMTQSWCSDCQRVWFDDEQPAHEVYLDALWIYKHEVTNKQYRLCISAGECEGDLDDYPADDYPTVAINWFEADAFCQWAGGRLPTEAEWEKAARGTDGRRYPWGEDSPTCSPAQYGHCLGGTVPVGSFPKDASPYGALDMAGNVWEWVADWYDPDYYVSSPGSNPTGPSTGINRVVRGGSCGLNKRFLHSSCRFEFNPGSRWKDGGFRCVVEP